MSEECREQLCWKCGKNKSTNRIYGYTLCKKCASEDIDPEEMEIVVTKSFEEGRLIPLDEIPEEERY